MMMLYQQCLPEGSTRRAIWDTYLKRQRKRGRLPVLAADVFEELKKKLQVEVRETSFQKQCRLDREFEQLELGRLSYAKFRVAFEAAVNEKEDAGMEVPSTETLKRNYLTKIDASMRGRVMDKTHEIDGPYRAPRKPATWQEVAWCITEELETSADIKAPEDRVHALEGRR